MRKYFAVGLLIFASLFADPPELPHRSPEEMHQTLEEAEEKFQHALTLFNPWYSGPIIAGGSSTLAPGMLLIQPYEYITDNYAFYNENSESIHSSHPLWQIQEQFVTQAGITAWMDLAIAPTLTTNLKEGRSFTSITDLPVILGFRLLTQDVWVPGIKATINETFPTGKYQSLSVQKKGTDSTGGGAYVTSFSLRFGKILFWWTHHPLNTRVVLQYNVPSTVRVEGLNAYGGGYGTKGKVRPGNNFVADLGLEWSLTQNWALATDVFYQTSARTKFNGDPGIDPSTGKTATVGGGSSYTFQLSPSIEYNWSDSLAAIGGIWFSPYGRNSGNFITYTFSIYYAFGV